MNTDQNSRLEIGVVGLKVADLERMRRFYVETLGMSLYEENADEALLGAGGRALVRLAALPGGRRVRGVTGLYHFALLLPDRAALGHALQRLIRYRAPNLGASDHGVSEALYLSDPEGNGIEIYRDRPAAEWPRGRGGELLMVTDPLDRDGVLRAGREHTAEEDRLPDGTRTGHVHLQVSDLARSEQFYTGLLGFDLMQRYEPSAAFLSMDGYHHHVGINTWGTAGAPPPPADALGLESVMLLYPGGEAYSAAARRLKAAGWPAETGMHGLFVRDPAGNGLWISPPAP